MSSSSIRLSSTSQSIQLKLAESVPGDAATVEVGSVTTLPAGQNATVNNVGTSSNAVLNFGIPQGEDGTDGDDGDVIGPGSTIDNEIVLWNGTGGNQIKRASTTGILKASSGVIAQAVAGTDYYNPGGTDVAVADGGTGRSSHTEYAVICGGTSSTGAQQSIAGVGTSGQVLTSNGAAALPTFQNAGGPTLLASGSFPSAATLDITNIPATYAHLALDIVGASMSGANALFIYLSSDNGSSFPATNYMGYQLDEAGAYAAFTDRLLNFQSIAAAASWTGYVRIYSYQGGMFATAVYDNLSSDGQKASGQSSYIGGTTAINAIRITSGSADIFDAGAYALYGIR